MKRDIKSVGISGLGQKRECSLSMKSAKEEDQLVVPRPL